tara:strand:+ start:2240 stop:2497 length:258 start_codon:yes stop_codon:yes gene_type:complete
MSEIRPELHLWVAYLEKKEELEEAQDRIEVLEAALKGITAWVAEWTDHVGDCSHKNETCSCGRVFVLHEARAALEGDKNVHDGSN